MDTSFIKCLEFEDKTKGFVEYALINFKHSNIKKVDYNTSKESEELQNKGIDYITDYKGYSVWIDSKQRSYKGIDYKDIVLEAKAFDFNIKKMDYIFYILPNKDSIECYLLDINKIINNPLSLHRSYIIPFKEGKNEELLILDINNLVNNKFCIYKKFSYSKFNREYFKI